MTPAARKLFLRAPQANGQNCYHEFRGFSRTGSQAFLSVPSSLNSWTKGRGRAGKRRCRARTPRPVGTSAVCPEREASWSAERQFRFGPGTGIFAPWEAFCLTPLSSFMASSWLTGRAGWGRLPSTGGSAHAKPPGQAFDRHPNPHARNSFNREIREIREKSGPFPRKLTGKGLDLSRISRISRLKIILRRGFGFSCLSWQASAADVGWRHVER